MTPQIISTIITSLAMLGALAGGYAKLRSDIARIDAEKVKADELVKVKENLEQIARDKVSWSDFKTDATNNQQRIEDRLLEIERNQNKLVDKFGDIKTEITATKTLVSMLPCVRDPNYNCQPK